MKANTKKVLGWHFLRESRKLGYADGRKVRAGQTYKATGEIKICGNGMHASERIIDALGYAPGPIVCRVELSGRMVVREDKLAARSRRVLWMFDASKVLHEFACRCAEDALATVKNPDKRSVYAIKAKRLWLAGKITDAELGRAEESADQAFWECPVDSDDAYEVARDAARKSPGRIPCASDTPKNSRRLGLMIAAAHKAQGAK